MKITRMELAIIHQGLRRLIHDIGVDEDEVGYPVTIDHGHIAKELARRIYSAMSDYDTEMKLGIEIKAE